MRVTNFSDADKLIPYQHKHAELGTFYIPELSTFELEDYTATVAAHSIKLAENTYAESKEVEEVLPLSPNFNYDGQNIAVWQGRKKPENLYEEKLMNKAVLTFTQITLTMFLCDSEGECICPFDEAFGTVKRERLKLFAKFITDEEAVKSFNKFLLGIKEEEATEVPNVKKSVKKKL